MQKEHLTPLAVLLGSVVIAAALYLGLQQAQPPPAPAAPSRPDLTAPPAAPQAAPQPPRAEPGIGLAPAGASAELRQRVQEEAARALEARRAELVKTCWDPSFKKNPDPPRAKYLFNVAFDPSGKEVGRGISDVRGMARPDAGQCLRQQPMGLQVTPPGTNVQVELELYLP